MVSVPVRADVPVFAVVVYVTVPGPVPLAPVVTVIQLALLVAVHVQPVCVVTFTVDVLPAAGSASVVGATVNEHGALCVTVNVCPAIVRVPVRADVDVFAATL